MKRLFKRFDQETGIATDIMLNGEDKYDLQYYQGVKTETVTDKIAQVSSAFNEWVNHLLIGPQEINKFMVRKWVEKFIKHKK